jgi:hypothetical protein
MTRLDATNLCHKYHIDVTKDFSTLSPSEVENVLQAAIVTAVNHQAMLVEALEQALDCIKQATDKLEEQGIDTGDYSIDIHDIEQTLAAVKGEKS